MANCKVTQSLLNTLCAYALAGARSMYVANWYPPINVASDETDPIVPPVAVPGNIVYATNADGYITDIVLPDSGEKFYQIDGADDTISFTDALLAGANGAKYRQQTANAVLNQYDVDVLNQADALSLGKFIVIIVKSDGQYVVLGRTNGLGAPAGGFDFSSGAAPADASGWTIILQGSSTEVAPLLLSGAVVTPIYTGP